MSPSPPVVLAECTTMDGHRWSYARMYARILEQLGFAVTYTCVDGDVERLRREFREHGVAARVVPLEWDVGSRVGFRIWRLAARAGLIERGDIDHFWLRLFMVRRRVGLLDAPVVVPWLSPVLRGGLPTALAFLLPRDLFALDGYLAPGFDTEGAALYEHARAVLCLNEPAAAELGPPFLPWPDPIDETVHPKASSAFLDEVRTRAAGRPIVACPGISRRKHTPELVRAAFATEPRAAFFVVTGEPSQELAVHPDWRQLVDAAPDHLLIREEALSDPDLEGLFAASAAAFLCYAEHTGSSGMLTRAVRHQTPVLVSPGGLMAARTLTYRLGAVAQTLEPEPLSAHLLTLARSQCDLDGAPAYLERHSVAELTRELKRLLRDWL